MSFDMAGLGGNTKFMQPRAEAIWYKPTSRKTSHRRPRRGRIHPALRRHDCAADLPEDLPRRRVQHARVRPPVGLAARPDLGRAGRRQQEPAVQRRIPHFHCRTGAACALLRCRAGARHRRRFTWQEKIVRAGSAGHARADAGGRRFRHAAEVLSLAFRCRSRRGRWRRRTRSRRRRARRSASSCRC